MSESGQWYVSKREQTMDGQKVNVGQLVRPSGSRNDRHIFGDNTHWVYRWDGGERDALLCETDGCQARFASMGSLDRHRQMVHAPERDSNVRARAANAQARKDAEQRGEMIGGHPIIGTKKGPRGDVPYIQPLG